MFAKSLLAKHYSTLHFGVVEHDDIRSRAHGNAARCVHRCFFDCASRVCRSAEQETRAIKAVCAALTRQDASRTALAGAYRLARKGAGWGDSPAGKPPGRPRGSRNALSETVICAFLRDFREHGQRAIAKVRRTQPAAYLKLAVLLVPREHKVEQTNVITGLSDEQLEAMIEDIQDRLDRRAAGDQAKVIEGEAVETTAVATTTPLVLEPPKRRPNRPIMEADTAIGPKPRLSRRKAQVPDPTRLVD